MGFLNPQIGETCRALYVGRGDVSRPAVSFEARPNTGMFLQGDGDVAFAVGGVEVLVLGAAGLLFDDGLVGAPSIAFEDDTDTGIYSPANGEVAITTDGVQRLSIDATDLVTTVPMRGPDGAVGAAAYSFSADVNTGIIRNSADFLSIVVGGVAAVGVRGSTIGSINLELTGTYVAATADSTGFAVVSDVEAGLDSGSLFGVRIAPFFAERGAGTHPSIAGLMIAPSITAGAATTTTASCVELRTFVAPGGTTNAAALYIVAPPTGATTNLAIWVDAGQVAVPLGLATAPSYSFEGDLDTGIYSSVANEINLTTAGVERMSIDATDLFVNVPVRGALGAVGAPAYSFSADTNTGVFSTGADNLSLVTGGVTRISMDPTGDVTVTPSVETSGSPTHWTLTGAAHLTLAAGVEATDINYNLARTVQFTAGGAIANQRAVRIQAPTYGFTAASTMTIASTVEISGAPVLGANATFTDSYALRNAGGQLGVPLGAVGTPSYTFEADRDTGMFSLGANQINFATSGVTRWSIGDTGLTATQPILVGGGVEGTPSIAFSGDANTGIWQSAVDTFDIAINGVNRIRLDGFRYDFTQAAASSGTRTAHTLTGGAHTTLTAAESTDVNFALARTVQFSTGSFATQRAVRIQGPTWGFVAPASTITDAVTLDVEVPVVGANMTFTNTWGVRSTGRYGAPIGSAAAPSYSFSADPNTGMFSPAADRIQFTTAGVATLEIDATGNMLFVVDNADDIGASAATRPRSVYVGTSVIPALGLVTAPSYTFQGDTDTGMYSSAGGSIDFTSDTTRLLTMSAGGFTGRVGTFNFTTGAGVVIGTTDSNALSFRTGASVVRISMTGDGTITTLGGQTDATIGTFDHRVRVVSLDARTATIDPILTLGSVTSGVPAANIGTGIDFEAESADENPSVLGSLNFAFSDVTAGSEDSYVDLLLRVAGAVAETKYRFASTAGIGFQLDLTHAVTADRTITFPDITGTVALTSAAQSLLTSSASLGFGFATGAGGTVTQGGAAKTTGVTLNTNTGEIVMDAASLAADTTVTFTLTNSSIAAADHVIVSHIGVGALGSYVVACDPAAGSAAISVRNVTAGALAEAIVLKFSIIKAVTA